MTNSTLAELEAQIKRLQQREAELKRWILDHPEDRWGEQYYAHLVGGGVILKEIVHDKK